MAGLKINVNKTKEIRENVPLRDNLVVDGEVMERVDSFQYLGSNVDAAGEADEDIELGIECSPASASLDLKRVDRLCHALENKDQLMTQVRKHLRLRAVEPNRVKLPTLADRFTHSRNFEDSTLKYFTTGRLIPPGCERDVTKEPNPFSSPKHTDILKKVFEHTENRNQPPETCFVHKYCMAPCICKGTGTSNGGLKKCSKPTSRTNVPSDVNSTLSMKTPKVNPISARLHVPEAPIPLSKTNTDPEYFNVARGRPVKETFNRHEFSRIQKTVFFQKLFTGFLEDEVKKRQEHHRLDMWQLTNISQELDRMKKTQELFANQSHAESVSIVTDQMAINKIRERREDELLRCKGYVNVIKSSLYKKDDMLSTSMYCRDILLQLSPTKFRTEYEEEVKKYRNETRKLANKAISIFTDYCRYNPDPEPDLFLNEVVHTFVKQLLSLGPPKIYFKHKWEIDLVFRKMELHCLEQMADLGRMYELEDDIDSISRDVKKYYATQTNLVKQEIESFRVNSEYQNHRSLELENEANSIINTSFKDIVSGDVMVETLALVEVLYNYVLGPSNAKFEGPEMMLQIEEELRNIDIQIKEIGQSKYRMYEKKVEKRMAREMKQALKAKAKDREVRSAIKRIGNLYSRPPYGPGWRRLVYRSHPCRKVKKRIPAVEEKKKEEKKLHRHLQLDGICDRDDVEAEIEVLLKQFTRRRTESASETDGSSEWNSSLRSSVSSNSINEAIQPLFDLLDEDEDSEKSLSLVQLGYDSEEELLRKNYDKKKQRGEEIKEPEVLYEIRSIDSKFNVSSKSAKPKIKDQRHEHRTEPPVRTHPLSWR